MDMIYHSPQRIKLTKGPKMVWM